MCDEERNVRYSVEMLDRNGVWVEAEPHLATADRYPGTRELAEQAVDTLRDQDVEEHGQAREYRIVEVEGIVRCECGDVTGVLCEWVGDADEMVVVEWMPRYLRASHEAAGNRGTYPANGAWRLRLERDICAPLIVDTEDGWAHVVPA